MSNACTEQRLRDELERLSDQHNGWLRCVYLAAVCGIIDHETAQNLLATAKAKWQSNEAEAT